MTDHTPEMLPEQGGPLNGPLRTSGLAPVRTGPPLYRGTRYGAAQNLTVDPYDCEQCGQRICAAYEPHQPCAACQAERNQP